MFSWSLLVDYQRRKELTPAKELGSSTKWTTSRDWLIRHLEKRISHETLSEVFVLGEAWKFLLFHAEYVQTALQAVYKYEQTSGSLTRVRLSDDEIKCYNLAFPPHRRFHAFSTETSAALRNYQEHAAKLGVYAEDNHGRHKDVETVLEIVPGSPSVEPVVKVEAVASESADHDSILPDTSSPHRSPKRHSKLRRGASPVSFMLSTRLSPATVAPTFATATGSFMHERNRRKS